MIVLNSTSDNLDISLIESTVSPLQCYSAWRDRNSTTFVAGKTANFIGSIGDSIFVTGPSQSFQRIIDFISIHNPNSASITVDLKVDANGTQRTLFKNSIPPSESLHYQDGFGFYIVSTAGTQKETITSGIPPASGINFATGGTAISSNGTSLRIVPNLSFPVLPSKSYYFKALCAFSASATSVGSRWSITGPSNISILGYKSMYSRFSFNSNSNVNNTVTRNSNVSIYDSPSSASSTSATTGGNLAIIEGLIKTNATGSVSVDFASSLAGAGITCLPYSVIYYQQTY